MQCRVAADEQANRHQSPTALVERVVQFVESNYARPISLGTVADAIGYSRSHLTTAFRHAMGMPVTAWIIHRRMTAARELLGENNLSVARTCEAVGFTDLCYFTRQFVRHVGVTPGRFRAANNGTRSDKIAAPHVITLSNGT
jgi:AraC-like DNA-binding protein